MICFQLLCHSSHVTSVAPVHPSVVAGCALTVELLLSFMLRVRLRVYFSSAIPALTVLRTLHHARTFCSSFYQVSGLLFPLLLPRLPPLILPTFHCQFSFFSPYVISLFSPSLACSKPFHQTSLPLYFPSSVPSLPSLPFSPPSTPSLPFCLNPSFDYSFPRPSFPPLPPLYFPLLSLSSFPAPLAILQDPPPPVPTFPSSSSPPGSPTYFPTPRPPSVSSLSPSPFFYPLFLASHPPLPLPSPRPYRFSLPPVSSPFPLPLPRCAYLPFPSPFLPPFFPFLLPASFLLLFPRLPTPFLPASSLRFLPIPFLLWSRLPTSCSFTFLPLLFLPFPLLTFLSSFSRFQTISLPFSPSFFPSLSPSLPLLFRFPPPSLPFPPSIFSPSFPLLPLPTYFPTPPHLRNSLSPSFLSFPRHPTSFPTLRPLHLSASSSSLPSRLIDLTAL
ncbi:hypothetical protein C7M84_014020 [Penaeus vannamei]|uniref:Uncharacterized protein n=1 Tax=Penaeus vannamei TaxID=6689 RepID=A0A423SUL8_PENVA|nr:hypothetical protein C7M84_014020 [Penaeus vannamei]